jgi:hypothetical protein
MIPPPSRDPAAAKDGCFLGSRRSNPPAFSPQESIP